MSRHIFLSLAAAAVSCCATAREAGPELRSDIARWMAMQAEAAARDASWGSGESFFTGKFLDVYRQTLANGKEVDWPDESECPAAAALASAQIRRFDGDYDFQAVFTMLEDRLRRPAPDREEQKKEEDALCKKLVKTYQPLLEQREADKEKLLLHINATRPEVTVLPNGVQLEHAPGKDSIREITRGTSETGIAFYTRITNNTAFDRLPESVRQMADHLPRASSWTFYIPAAAEQAVKDSRRREEEKLREQRQAKLRQLIPARIKSYPEERVKDHEVREQHRPLLKLKVWKDDPLNPVKVLPDVTENVI